MSNNQIAVSTTLDKKTSYLKKTESLRQQGFEVNCIHLRHPKGSKALIPISEARKNKIELGSQGGLTVVTVRSPSGLQFFSSSQCCAKDNFNRHRGYQIALDRVIQQLKERKMLDVQKD